MFNNDVSYAQSRVIGTFMFNTKENALVHITDIVPDGGSRKLDKATVYYWMIDDKNRRKEATCSSTDLRFSVGRLGYVDTPTTSKYMLRLPLRRDWRQGLRASQLAFSREFTTSSVSSQWLSENIQYVSNTVKGAAQIPIQQIMEKVEETGIARSINRAFALSNRFSLMYKGAIAGKVNRKDKFVLNENFNFLVEELAAVVGEESIAQ